MQSQRIIWKVIKVQPPDLSHVFWLGGATCAGKTSVADRLAQMYGWQVYHYDQHEPDHVARRLQVGDQQIAAFLALSMDERWLLRTPEVMAQETIVSWGAAYQTSDPARALDTIIARDELIAQHQHRAAQDRGLATYGIDGARSLDEVTATIAAYYTDPAFALP
jgi:hypothetical protein